MNKLCKVAKTKKHNYIKIFQKNLFYLENKMINKLRIKQIFKNL